MPAAYDASDFYDQRAAVLEILGRGVDAVAFGARLARMYLAFAKSQRWRVRKVWPYPPEGRGKRLEAVFQIAEPGVYERLKYESGLHQVIDTNGTERGVTVEVKILPEAMAEEISLRDGDVVIDMCRHGDIVDLGIASLDPMLRIRHLPTGIQVWCNRPFKGGFYENPCMAALKARLLDHQRTHVRQPATVIRIYDLTTDQVLDTRLPEPMAGASRMLDGDLGPLLDDLWLHGMKAQPR